MRRAQEHLCWRQGPGGDAARSHVANAKGGRGAGAGRFSLGAAPRGRGGALHAAAWPRSQCSCVARVPAAAGPGLQGGHRTQQRGTHPPTPAQPRSACAPTCSSAPSRARSLACSASRGTSARDRPRGPGLRGGWGLGGERAGRVGGQSARGGRRGGWAGGLCRVLLQRGSGPPFPRPWDAWMHGRAGRAGWVGHAQAHTRARAARGARPHPSPQHAPSHLHVMQRVLHAAQLRAQRHHLALQQAGASGRTGGLLSPGSAGWGPRCSCTALMPASHQTLRPK